MAEREELAEYERHFRRSGLPLFIEDYSASEDVFTRALPLLGLVFVAEMLGAIELDWPLLLNIVAALGGLAILVCAFGLVNRLQGRRFWSLPTRVGVPELVAFVVLPALLPLIFGGQLRQVGGVMLGNSALLLLIYAVVGFGLSSTVFWALTRVAGELAASLSRLVRALPLLLVFSVVLFVNTEMWQVFDRMPRPFVFLVAALFAVLGVVFLVLRVPGEVGRLEAEAGHGGPPLNRRQRVNVGITLVVSQLLQVLVVSVGIGVFFVAFGALAIGAEVREAWDVADSALLIDFELLGYDVQVTETLLRVSGGIAAITGLYYAIAILTDATYRQEFLDGVIAELESVFAARIEYLERRQTLAAGTS